MALIRLWPDWRCAHPPKAGELPLPIDPSRFCSELDMSRTPVLFFWCRESSTRLSGRL